MAINELERYEEILRRLENLETITLLASKQIFNRKEAAKYLGVCPDTFSEYVRMGHIKIHKRTNIIWYVEKEELDRFMLSDERLDTRYKDRVRTKKK